MEVSATGGPVEAGGQQPGPPEVRQRRQLGQHREPGGVLRACTVETTQTQGEGQPGSLDPSHQPVRTFGGPEHAGVEDLGDMAIHPGR